MSRFVSSELIYLHCDESSDEAIHSCHVCVELIRLRAFRDKASVMWHLRKRKEIDTTIFGPKSNLRRFQH